MRRGYSCNKSSLYTTQYKVFFFLLAKKKKKIMLVMGLNSYLENC